MPMVSISVRFGGMSVILADTALLEPLLVVTRPLTTLTSSTRLLYATTHTSLAIARLMTPRSSLTVLTSCWCRSRVVVAAARARRCDATPVMTSQVCMPHISSTFSTQPSVLRRLFVSTFLNPALILAMCRAGFCPRCRYFSCHITTPSARHGQPAIGQLLGHSPDIFRARYVRRHHDLMCIHSTCFVLRPGSIMFPVNWCVASLRSSFRSRGGRYLGVLWLGSFPCGSPTSWRSVAGPAYFSVV